MIFLEYVGQNTSMHPTRIWKLPANAPSKDQFRGGRFGDDTKLLYHNYDLIQKLPQSAIDYLWDLYPLSICMNMYYPVWWCGPQTCWFGAHTDSRHCHPLFFFYTHKHKHTHMHTHIHSAVEGRSVTLMRYTCDVAWPDCSVSFRWPVTLVTSPWWMSSMKRSLTLS